MSIDQVLLHLITARVSVLSATLAGAATVNITRARARQTSAALSAITEELDALLGLVLTWDAATDH